MFIVCETFGQILQMHRTTLIVSFPSVFYRIFVSQSYPFMARDRDTFQSERLILLPKMITELQRQLIKEVACDSKKCRHGQSPFRTNSKKMKKKAKETDQTWIDLLRNSVAHRRYFRNPIHLEPDSNSAQTPHINVNGHQSAHFPTKHKIEGGLHFARKRKNEKGEIK